MADLYATLGVPRTADAAAIKRAYRKLAKELHPDQNKDNPKAAERFKAVTAAYDILSDSAKRAAYDRGEIDSDGNPRMPPGFDGFRRSGAPGGAGSRGRPGAEPPPFEADFGDILSELFGNTRSAGRGFGTAPRKGADVAYRLTVPLAEAATGKAQRITLKSGRTIDLKLPPGVEDGQQLRLAGQGDPGPAGAGDALVTIQIAPDPRFTRDADDLRTDLMVPLETAVLGGKVRAPTADGEVLLSIQPGTTSGRLLRLKEKGWTRKSGGRGDLLVRILVDVPADPELAAWARARQEAAAAS